jgi:hypothetical protein
MDLRRAAASRACSSPPAASCVRRAPSRRPASASSAISSTISRRIRFICCSRTSPSIAFVVSALDSLAAYFKPRISAGSSPLTARHITISPSRYALNNAAARSANRTLLLPRAAAGSCLGAPEPTASHVAVTMPPTISTSRTGVYQGGRSSAMCGSDVSMVCVTECHEGDLSALARERATFRHLQRTSESRISAVSAKDVVVVIQQQGQKQWAAGGGCTSKGLRWAIGWLDVWGCLRVSGPTMGTSPHVRARRGRGKLCESVAYPRSSSSSGNSSPPNASRSEIRSRVKVARPTTSAASSMVRGD